jgi:phage terminase small subunit
MIVAKLTAKQKRFCDEYLIDLNATQAAIRSGYSEKTAYSQGQRMLKNVEVKAFIDSELERIRTDKIADVTEIMEYLTSVMRGESQSEIVVVENIGDFTSEARLFQKAPDEKERLRAAELMGKRYNMFSDKMKVDVAMPVVISGGEDLAD